MSLDDSESEEDVAGELEWPFEDDTDETLADEQHEEITDEQRKEEGGHEVSAEDLTEIRCPDIIDLEILNDFTVPRCNTPVSKQSALAKPATPDLVVIGAATFLSLCGDPYVHM